MCRPRSQSGVPKRCVRDRQLLAWRAIVAVRAAVAQLRLWRARSRERWLLSQMDERQLTDIRLSRVDAWRELQKPPWRE